MRINPERLRRLRKEKGLSRATLAKRSKVSERTIQRLENESERTQTNQKDTLEGLAKALGVEEGVLTGDVSFPDASKTPNPERVQIGAQVAPKARLAYDLIRCRYGVSTTEIINMAPLFFTLLAEGSLAWRRDKLEEASDAIGRLEQVDREMGYRIFDHGAIYAGNAHTVEQESIDKADLFGDHLLGTVWTNSFDPSEGNPFACYLRKLANDLDSSGVVKVEGSNLSYGTPTVEVSRLRPLRRRTRQYGQRLSRCQEGSRNRLRATLRNSRGTDGGRRRPRSARRWLQEKLPDIYKGLEEGQPMAEFVRFEATATPEQLDESIAKLEEKLAHRRQS